MTDAITLLSYYLPNRIINDIDMYMGITYQENIPGYPTHIEVSGIGWSNFNGYYNRFEHPSHIFIKHVHYETNIGEDFTTETQEWYFDGVLHRLRDPVKQIYMWDDSKWDGQLKAEGWWYDGQLYRLRAPAKINYNADGTISMEEWLYHGMHHRLEGPAVIYYKGDGTIAYEDWIINGKLFE